jgi:hypothetical protein
LDGVFKPFGGSNSKKGKGQIKSYLSSLLQIGFTLLSSYN